MSGAAREPGARSGSGRVVHAGRALWLIATMAWLGATRAAAQVPFLGGELSGTVDAGARFFADEPGGLEWAKFGEYTNRYSGAYLPGLHFTFESANRLEAELRAFDVGRNDQRWALSVFEPGRFTFDASFSQTPHIYTTTARLLGGESSQGVFPLSTPRPVDTDYNGAAVLSPVESRWDAGRVSLGVTPREGWTVQAEYSRTAKRGERPMGMAFGSPGNNFREILEPIDQTTHDFRLSQGIAGAKYRLQMSYDLSVFQNAVDRVEADNPGSDVDLLGGAPARGRTALAPDNVANTLAAAASAGPFPLRTRFTGSLSYAWWRQNQAFLPYTGNSTITAPAPPAGLDGDQRILNASLAATSSPARALTLSARYRRYRMDDQTPDLILPLIVINDRSVTTGPLEREYHSYDRNSAHFDAGWRPAREVRFKLGWSWDQWNRGAAREVPTTDEHTPLLALDLSVSGWLSVRSSVSRGWRRSDAYTPVAAAQLPELRKFDMADRNQDRAEMVFQLTPPGRFAGSVSYSRGRDRYPNSAYGIVQDRNWSAGGDASWTPSERFSAFATYTYERYDVRQQSRTRTPPALLDNLTYDWVGNTNDRIHTVGARLEATLVPEKLDVGARWDFYDARTDMMGSNPLTPTGGTAAQDAQAVAADFPAIRKELHSLDASLRYRFLPNWSATVRYVLERLRETDVRTDGLVPAPPPPASQGDVFLGSDVLGYDAGYLVVTLGYNIGRAPPRLVAR